jgi:hypothetical protein
MYGMHLGWGSLLLCLIACANVERAAVTTHRERSDGGATSGVWEAFTASDSTNLRSNSVTVGATTPKTAEQTGLAPGDGGTMQPIAELDGGASTQLRGDAAEAGGGARSVVSTGDAASTADAEASVPDVNPLFQVGEEEDCSGVQFVDPVRACEDLRGLSLSDPLLVTDEDGEWNAGDTATLTVDLVGAERESGEYYDTPAILAAFDSQSSKFASVRWRNTELFGLDAGAKFRHEIDLSLTPEAPRGTRVWLYLEPGTSSGHTTGCDCEGVEVTGLTLSFEVR